MRQALTGSLLLLLAACPNDNATTAPAAAPGSAVGELASPADSPMPYKVLADTADVKANTVDFHVLVVDSPKHDDVEKLLKFLYRHLMLRKQPQPNVLTASVYSNEAQYKTPPRSPIATVQQKDGKPAFENKVPLEFWQQIEVALFGEEEKAREERLKKNQAMKLAMKIERDEAKKGLTLTLPYVEGGKDEWAETLSFNQAMNIFTDAAQGVFEKVPELATLTYVGTWSDCKDHAATCKAEEVVKITLDRDGYHSLKLHDVEEAMGQLHGRAYLEMSTNRGSDASISKANSARMAAIYKKMLAQLKGNAWVSPKLK